MNDLVSIIIPVYNAQNTIVNCLTSIFKQNYKNIEVILVDDYSSDESPKLIKTFADKVTYIRNDKNMGAGFSRNVGIKQSKGKFICFIDSDDEINDIYIESLLKSILENDADISVCDIVSVDRKKKKVIKFSFENKKDLINNAYIASPCGKIFKHDQFNGTEFKVGIINEDIATIIPLIVKANKISYSSDAKYFYIHRDNSVQGTSINVKKFDVFKAVDIALERIKDEDLYDTYKDCIIFNQIFYFLIYMLVPEKKFIARYRFIKLFIKKSSYDLIGNHNFKKFLSEQTKAHRIFYKGLLIGIKIHSAFITNLLVSSFNSLKKFHQRKTVNQKIITVDDLVKMAHFQSGLDESDLKISVVVPNYNYDEFLIPRIYSILYQRVKIFELIILDDNSSDNSKMLIQEIDSKISKYVKVKVHINDINSGNVFKQWNKGFAMSTGDYVWMAEADDYCDQRFLSSIVSEIRKENNVALAYTNTAYINGIGNKIFDDVKSLIDLQKTGHWDQSYCNSGIQEILDYEYLNCTIANVSSVLFRNANYEVFLKESTKCRQVGDWLFYLQVMSTGDVLYINKSYNYYRVHGNNTTLTTQKISFLKEIQFVHQWVSKTYPLSDTANCKIKERHLQLEKEWDIKLK